MYPYFDTWFDTFPFEIPKLVVHMGSFRRGEEEDFLLEKKVDLPFGRSSLVPCQFNFGINKIAGGGRGAFHNTSWIYAVHRLTTLSAPIFEATNNENVRMKVQSSFCE